MRRGFTLIELILVVLIMLILLTLTVAVVGNVLDNDRVRGASRQVKNYLAGARDRAIYSASRVEVGSGETPPRVGVRYLANPALMVPDPDTGRPVYRGFSSMVFVQENRPMEGNLRIFEDPVGSGDWFVSQFMQDNTTPLPGVGATAIELLIQRGLVETRWERDPPITGDFQEFYYLPLTFPARDSSLKMFYVRFLRASPYIQGNYLLKAPLSAPLPGIAPLPDEEIPAIVHMLPSPLPSEEPRLLPDGTIIEVQSSVVGSGPKLTGSLPMNVSLKNLARADGSFDIMFNAQGVVDGPIAAAGLVHLVIADLQDIERGFGIIKSHKVTGPPPVESLYTGSPFLDTNDDISDGVDPIIEEGKSVERQGDVRIVSIRTQTGGTSIAPIDPSFDSSTNRFVDPFRFAETGEEAR